MTWLDAVGGLRAVYGTALLLRPGALLGALSDTQIDRRTCLVARVLGLREIVQALVLARRRSRGWILGGAAVDATHAATMIALALLDAAHRGPASVSAVEATACAAAELHVAFGA